MPHPQGYHYGMEQPVTGPRIIAVSNNKGGVAKTTSTVNLGACFAEMGFRTLIIDLDPQGNASSSLGIDTRDLEYTIYDVLIQEVPLEDAVEPTAVKNLFVVPSNINLAGAEIELVPAFGRESRLKNAISPVAEQWDYILIDCPPSVGLLTVNALTAASEILTPVQTEYIPLEGIDILLKNLHLIRKNLNPALPDPTFLCVMYQRTNLADQVVAELRNKFGDRVYETVIPRNVRLSEAPSFGQPITTFDSSSNGAKAYRAAAKEIHYGAQKRIG